MNKVSKSNVFKAFLWLTFAVGVFLRIKYFLLFRWLWADEVSLAINIYDTPFIRTFMPLEYAQSSPPLFLFFSKIILELFKHLTIHHLQSLRIIPFISSLISIPAFYLLSKKFIQNKINLLISNIIFCLNVHLIYFCQDFKQYSSDVCFFILVLLTYFYIDLKKITKLQMIGITTFYIFSSWFSITANFAIITVLIALTSQNNFKDHIKKFFWITFPFLISLIPLYFSQKYAASDSRLLVFWNDGFINLQNPISFFSVVYNAINYYFYKPTLICIIIYLLLSGVYTSLKKIRKPKNQLLIIPIFLMCCCSTLYLYPFHSRLSLYLFPIIIILICRPLEIIKNYTYKQILIILFLIFVLHNIFISQKPFVPKFGDLHKLLNRYQKENIIDPSPNYIILTNFDTGTYLLYNKVYDFNKNNNIIQLKDTSQQSINSLGQHKRYYFINTVWKVHPDITSLTVRKKYYNNLINNIKNANNVKILNTWIDSYGNILIKFEK